MVHMYSIFRPFPNLGFLNFFPEIAWILFLSWWVCSQIYFPNTGLPWEERVRFITSTVSSWDIISFFHPASILSAPILPFGSPLLSPGPLILSAFPTKKVYSGCTPRLLSTSHLQLRQEDSRGKGQLWCIRIVRWETQKMCAHLPSFHIWLTFPI